MFNQRRGFGLYQIIGVAAGVLALAGAGTAYFFTRRSAKAKKVMTQAKRSVKRAIPQVTKAASQIKLNGRSHKSASKAKSHAKPHHVNGVNHARA